MRMMTTMMKRMRMRMIGEEEEEGCRWCTGASEWEQRRPRRRGKRKERRETTRRDAMQGCQQS